MGIFFSTDTEIPNTKILILKFLNFYRNIDTESWGQKIPKYLIPTFFFLVPRPALPGTVGTSTVTEATGRGHDRGHGHAAGRERSPRGRTHQRSSCHIFCDSIQSWALGVVFNLCIKIKLVLFLAAFIE